MKAWLIDQLTGIEQLRLADIPNPAPSPGRVVLAVELAALNPADRYLAENQYPAHPTLPHVLGRDGVGKVVSVGQGVSGVQIGDRRAILRGDVGVDAHGTFAEQVSVDASSLVPIPPQWSLEEVAGAPLVHLSAYQALTQWEEMHAAVVLISGASGGVGVASVQLAKAMGHTVVVLSRSPEKRESLHKLGADFTADPQNAAWRDEALSQLAGRRVNLAIDNVGGPLLPTMISMLAENGRVSIVGRLAGAVPSFNTSSLLFRRLRIGGVAAGSYTSEQSHAAWKEIVRLMQTRGVRPVVDTIFSFDELPRAFERLAQGPMGKVLLRVND